VSQLISALCTVSFCFFYCYGVHRDLHSFPTRRSSDLGMYSSLRFFAGFSGLPWLDFHSIRDDDAEKGSSLSDGAEITAQFETFRSEEHTSELQSRENLVCRLLLEKKKK